MKTELKQKHSTLQDLIDQLQMNGTITHTDSSGSYIIVNGIRVYVQASEPVNAPTGSIWIGG